MSRTSSTDSTGDSTTVTSRRTRAAEKTKRPSMYVVLIHNDDFTPRGFVVEALKRFFQKTEDEATRIMSLAHNYGLGAVSKYPHEIAEAKAEQAMRHARDSGYPLNFSVQEE